MASEYILEMKHITKKFQSIVALSDMSIALKEGEILSICGENGAGKSTLMKILAGDYPYGSYSGEIEISGQPVKLTSTGEAEKAGIAMIYQEISVELDLSVAENIMLGIMPKTKFGLIDWKKTRETAKSVLHLLDLDLDIDATMRNLSASVQQLVCIARALVRKPRILILDEPTSALTESETELLIGILYQLQKTKISCIYISHKLDEVFRISDHIIVMRDSRYISTHNKSEIIPDKIIEDMIGRRLDSMYPSMEGRVIGEEILRVEGFTVQHPNSPKLIAENISFSVKKGEILGLAGLVGSGRSELLRAVFGALPKKKGEVYINNIKCNIENPMDAIQNGLGFLTEDRKKDGIVKTMDIGQNMTLSILKRISKGLFINRSSELKNITKYFNSLRIKAPNYKSSILSLSGGNQQKVVLAKSLLTEMKVLFLDEPTRGIDIGAKAEIYKIMEELANKGLSIVMISSEYPELLAMCDRFVVLGNGKIVGEMDKQEASETLLIRIASGV